MVRPAVHPLRVREDTLTDLRDEFLLRCQAKNLSARTIEWYEDRTRFFLEWCEGRGILRAADLTTSVLEEYVIDIRSRSLSPNTARGYAQVLKTMARLGHRKGLLPQDITRDFEMPKVPKVIVPTFSDDQLRTLLKQPDARTWIGVRDRAILLVFLDTLVRVSELVGLNAETWTSASAGSRSWARARRSGSCRSARPRRRPSAATSAASRTFARATRSS